MSNQQVEHVGAIMIGQGWLKPVLCVQQAYKNPGIPARCDICRQFGPNLQTNYVYLRKILSHDKNYMKKLKLAGIL